MTNMALTKSEKAEDSMLCCPPDGERKTPNYPWELKLYLTQSDLEKLGILERPPIGTLFTLTCQAIVAGSSERACADADGGEKTERTVDMQITDMTADATGVSTKPAAEVLYG